MATARHKSQRVAVFLDVQNLYHSAKNIFRARVNFKAVLTKAVADRQLIRAFAYVVKSEEATGETAFFEALEQLGIDLRMKDLQIYPGGLKKADWDVGLAVDAIRLAPSVDTIVLATGDGDFLPLVEYLQGHGKQVEVLAFGKSASARLKEKTDDFVDISESKYLIKISSTRR
ncbi:MAG: NYN domain-containing protein [Parcubacteria group bacterium]|nr:NYN domain-containing protein [Parcubacteria group bacterium]